MSVKCFAFCFYLFVFVLSLLLPSLCRGVVPFSQRKKMLEKARAKNKKPKSSAGISSIPNITVGTQVGRNLFLFVCCWVFCFVVFFSFFVLRRFYFFIIIFFFFFWGGEMGTQVHPQLICHLKVYSSFSSGITLPNKNI